MCARREEILAHDAKSVKTAQAIQLIQLGARASLVSQLTGLTRSSVKSLYHQIHGTPSPPGQSPFTDAWYVQSEHRMLHANMVWKLDCRLGAIEPDDAARLIDVYTCYLQSVHSALLCIDRAYFVPHLLLIDAWRQDHCIQCHVQFIGPAGDPGKLCPACKLQSLYRCESCDEVLEQKGVGRRARLCPACRVSPGH
jgi:hypothetical protein